MLQCSQHRDDPMEPGVDISMAACVVAHLDVIPVVGLVVGFAVGLLLSEVQRTRDFRTAVRSSGAALKATGIGILVEFGLACAAASTWIIGVWINAVNG